VFRFVTMLLLSLLNEPIQQVDFDTQVIPLLTRSGCNSGACHGAAAGRGGFHLSMLGADAASDFDAIAKAFEGRRINLVAPEESLVIKKPTEQLSHEGGSALDEQGYSRFLSWIKQGAQRTEGRKLIGFEVQPTRYVCTESSLPIQVQCVAKFSDGSKEDVTQWAVINSTDNSALTVDDKQRIHAIRPGQHVATVRFLDRIVPIQISVPYPHAPIDLSNRGRLNFIDEHIWKTLEELRIPPSQPASDAQWLRRVSLDLTGRLPTIERSQQFLSETALDKRSTLVDELLQSYEFSYYWRLRFSNQFRMHSLPNEPQAFEAYSRWLRNEIAAGTGFDQLAQQLILATGDSHEKGPVNFARMVQDARGHAELVGQSFAGIQLGCANCHNHPLDQWTQDDYHGLAAVFATLDRSQHVTFGKTGSVTNLRTGEPAVPRIPGDRFLETSLDNRQAVVEWVLNEKDSLLARSMVNRIWRAMFGRGLIEPVDDLRQTNPATHPELLDELAKDFVASGYQLRHTLRRIALSETYALSDASMEANSMDDRFYSHSYDRPLLPHVLVDAIADVTGVPDEYSLEHQAHRAIEIIDPSTPAPSLDILGRCRRVGGCTEKELASAQQLAGGLHLLNGPLINSKLIAPDGRLQRLISSGVSNSEIIKEFYLAAFSSSATNTTIEKWNGVFETADQSERVKRLEDFVWGLLNSRSFRSNH
jgi:Protein of unknown function (DUF1549)/Protein of unknown function (DUF1553)